MPNPKRTNKAYLETLPVLSDAAVEAIKKYDDNMPPVLQEMVDAELARCMEEIRKHRPFEVSKGHEAMRKGDAR